jgi:hypothetical protein
VDQLDSLLSVAESTRVYLMSPKCVPSHQLPLAVVLLLLVVLVLLRQTAHHQLRVRLS